MSLLGNCISALAILVSACLAVVGWSKAAEKDRTQHLFQRCLEKRLSMFDDVIAAVLPLLDSFNQGHPIPAEFVPELNKLLSKANVSVQLYGYKNEQRLYAEFADAINHTDNKRVGDALKLLVRAIREKLRAEMNYPLEEQSVYEPQREQPKGDS